MDLHIIHSKITVMPHKLQFKVIHASGQDDIYRASELNHHSPLTKGWQSARFCLYPQDMVIQLETRSRLRKIQILSHQFLIPTKIEFFVGDVPDGAPLLLESARYARLGYVSLSDNEKTGYKARELKSVHVDAVGHFLKLNIHKNHVNKHNLYNQVGIIAINVIGDELRRPYDITDPDLLLDDPRIERDPALEGLFNKPDYISPLDDLAFDMYQDPEIAQIIRRLERKKQEAVLQERYDYAKRLKQAITELQKVGEKLGKMEVEKRQAVENEDYDKARLKKVQMDEYRLQVYKDLNLNDLLELTGSRHPQHIDLEPVRHYSPPTPPPRLEELPPPTIRTPPHYEEYPLPRSDSVLEVVSTKTIPSYYPFDDMPLPNQKSKSVIEPITVPAEETSKSPRPPETNRSKNNSPRTPHDSRRLPPPKLKALTLEEELPPEPENNQEAEPMSEVDLREASTAIDIFGLSLVSKAYSKTWSYREDALTAVHHQMQQMPTGNKEEAKSMLRAAIFLVKRGIDDKVYAVFRAALHLYRMLLTEFVPKHKLGKPDITSAVEKTLPNLFHKAGDTAVRNRDDAKSFIQEMASFPEVKATQTLAHECVKPFKLTLGPRHAQSRCEIVESLYQNFGLKGGLTIDNIMKFNVEGLNHNAGEVRDVIERLIKTMYKNHGAPIKDYLPPDDEKTRKNTLWRQLFEYFDQVDGKPPRTDAKKQKAEEEQKKQAEIDALQKQLQALRDMNAGKALRSDRSNGPIDASVLSKNDPSKKAAPQKKKPEAAKVKPKGNKPTTKDDDDVSMFTVDNICIFCGERNESFTEEGLDIHYWKNCPMLKRCTNCKQVVEIATYTDHVLTECEAKSNFSKCPRCSEAIPKPEYDQHVADKACNPHKTGQNHCPLCHENISSGEDGWKEHLMGRTGCKQNPRRLLALNKPAGGAAGNKTTAARGRGGKAGSVRGRK
ncbi:centrosomal protein of 104 kDa-like isoform X2 [Biomphalaria glabrata]|uniref:Centrosomal protein of 104 kDa n=1 Tax=Biomphalaria glabrata TaxID=6526 RepID=A0A9W2YNL2_BIOGL|nr:centrosomal protein of 104 kDa-like isoform X2 [Biomphalaria glabrata]